MLSTMKKQLQRLFSRTAPPWDDRCLSVREFERLATRERARVDRLGGEFCIVAFELPDQAFHSRSVQRLTSTIAGRIRNTDDLGQLLDGRIAILAPDTRSSGAQIMARDIIALLPAELQTVGITIYEYPDRPDGEQNSVAEIMESAAGEEALVTASGADADATRQRLDAAHVASLETFLVKHMPWWKRTIDLLVAGLTLILAAPVFLLIALAIKLTSSGPVFYSQLRSGRGGVPFWMHKFRSMTVDADERKQELLALNEQDGPAFKITNDPRVTAIGKFLRKTSLDELPQLWNVIKGEMSLVGPRPLPVSETAGCTGWQRRRLEITPGLTCIWQIKGRSQVSFDEWCRMDLQYVDSRTPWHDMKILVLTVPAVLLRKGAS